MKVKILVEKWFGCSGILESKIPFTDWYNVRVSPTLRLVLTEEEFCREEFFKLLEQVSERYLLNKI